MRHGKGVGRSVVFGALVVGVIFMGAAMAAADVISPAGACTATGTWEGSGQSETSSEHDSSDVIEVPQSDTVMWTGAIGTNAPDATGPERQVSGQVQLALPIGSVTLGDWDDDSEKLGNSGTRSYDLPSVLIGIEMNLSGSHSEDGVEVCSGSVNLVVEGSPWSNPLTYGALVVLGASGFGLVAAAMAKGAS